MFHHYQRSHTTFVIASNLPDVKIRQKVDLGKLLSPKYIVDCLKENKILDYSKYLLYTNEKPSQPRLNFQKLGQNLENSLDCNVLESSNMKREDSMKQENIIKSEVSGNSLKRCETSGDSFKTKEVLGDSSELPSDFLNSTIEASKEDLDLAKALTELNENVRNSTKTPTPLPESSNKARTATDPNFLTDFFNNSRLHHIATLGAGFKQMVSDWRKKHDGNFPDRENLKEKLKEVPAPCLEKAIMHIDMDCFFVSVGLKKFPHLRGFPIAVTHSKGGATTQNRPGSSRAQEINLYNQRLKDKFTDDSEEVVKESRVNGIDENTSLSEIASCSYEARKCGVKNGMFVGQALKLCPNLKTIPYDFEGYKNVANTLYKTIGKYTLDIEAVSCDEMFVDLTSLLKDLKIDCMEFVSFVREEIRSETGCSCSAGVGSNRLQARLATKKAKPDGQFHLKHEMVSDYMRNVLITEIPGVGYSTAHQLKQMKWSTCEDLERISLGTLQQHFGKKFGDTLYNASRGIDERPLIFEHIRKSVSVEVNYGIRFTEMEQVDTFMKQLVGELMNRLKEIGKKGKQLTMKLMIRAKEAPVETMKFMGHGFCDSISKSLALPTFTDNEMLIESSVLKLLHSLSIDPADLRGIGLQLSKFEVDETNKGSNTLMNLFRKVAAKNVEKKRDSGEHEKIAGPSLIPENPKELVEDFSTKNKERGLDKWMKGVKENNNPNNSPSKLETSNIPHKNFPKKDTARSPGKKQRGRPPKHASFTRKPSNSDISEMFKAQKKEPQNRKIPPDLDFDVLMELPEEIRDEILRDYGWQTEIVQTKTPEKTNESIRVDQKFLELLGPQLRLEVEKVIDSKDIIVINDSLELEKTGKVETREEQVPEKFEEIIENEDKKKILPTSSDNVFLKKNWRQLLKSWLEFDKPNIKDVEVLVDNGQEMVQLNKINDLFIAMKYLFRQINETKNCKWHQVYYMILTPIKAKIQEIFTLKLLLDNKFDCEFC